MIAILPVILPLLAQSLFVMALFAAPSFALDEEALKKDLTGNMYRVHLSAEGRVIVEKRK